jgi:hypothetical protein
MASNDTTLAVNVQVNGAIANLQKLASNIQSVGQNFESIFSKASDYTQRLTGALAAAGVATAYYADQVVDIANAHQLATAEVLALGKALQQNGGDASKVGGIFQALSNSVEAANSGNIKTLTSFERLGVSIQDLGSLSNSELKDKLFKSLSQIKDPIERNALAQDIFNKTLAGADLLNLASDTAEATAKYQEHEEAIKDAAAAFDKMSAIMGDLKVAFATTFQPLFKYIKDLKIEVKDLVELWKAMAVALSIVTGAAVLGGFVKLIGVVKTLNAVVKGNPLIAIAGALLSIGAGMATYNSVSDQMAQATEENTAKIEEQPKAVVKVVRSQAGLIDVIEKQKASLQKAGAQLELNYQTSLKKLKADYDGLALSEDEKKVIETTAKIESDRDAALLTAKQAFDALDKLSQARNAAAYAEEKRLINNKADAQKKAATDQLAQTAEYLGFLRQLKMASDVFNDSRVKNFESIANFENNQKGIYEKIEAEGKLAQITKTRGLLNESLSKLAEADRSAGSRAVTELTTDVALLGKGYQDINGYIEEGIRKKVADGQITKAAGQAILETLITQGDQLNKSTTVFTANTSKITEMSRTFSYGWNDAFKKFSEDANNSALQAQTYFNSLTKGLEDSWVKFITTGKSGWKDFVSSMIGEIARSQIKSTLANLFGPMSGGGSNGLFGGAIIPGFLASGGPATAGKPYVVGEQGPELFVPRSSGTVVPNGAFGGGSTQYVTYNISAVDAQSFKSMIARDPSFIHAVAMQGASGIPSRR